VITNLRSLGTTGPTVSAIGLGARSDAVTLGVKFGALCEQGGGWGPRYAVARTSISGEVLVDREGFDGMRAPGVHLADGTQVQVGEVILFAGVYVSAAASLHSGVARPLGHAEHGHPGGGRSSRRVTPAGPHLLLQRIRRATGPHRRAVPVIGAMA
jgi:hypothetical protein